MFVLSCKNMNIDNNRNTNRKSDNNKVFAHGHYAFTLHNAYEAGKMEINLWLSSNTKQCTQKSMQLYGTQEATSGDCGWDAATHLWFFELWHSCRLSFADMCMLCDKLLGPERKSAAWMGYNSK